MASSVNEAILIGWLLTIIFAATAGIAFASTNIADVTLSRASRTTPAVQTAQAALADAGCPTFERRIDSRNSETGWQVRLNATLSALAITWSPGGQQPSSFFGQSFPRRA